MTETRTIHDPPIVVGVRLGLARALEFIFQFPPVYGVFDTGHGVVYIFGELHETEIEDVIVHETLHFVLLRMVGKRASLKLDKVSSHLS